MRVGRLQGAKRTPRTTSRVLALESLGSRVVLSAAAWGDVDMHLAPFDGDILNEPASVRSLDTMPGRFGIDAGTFGKELDGSWTGVPKGGYSLEPGRAFDSPVDASFGASRLASPGYFVAQTLAVSGGIYSVVLVPPPSLIFRFVTEAPSFPSISQLKADSYDAPPRDWPAGQSFDGLRLGPGSLDHPALPQVATTTPHTDTTAGDLTGSAGRLASFTQTPISQNVSNESRPLNTWLSTSSTSAAASNSVESAPPSKVALAPNRWESSAAELDDGMIELESPSLPRGKRVPKLGEELAEDEAASKDLLEQVWSGWDRAWDAFGELMRSKQQEGEERPADDKIAENSRGNEAQRIVDLEGGMIELATPAALPNGPSVGPGPTYLVQSATEEGEKVRMDAGVAMYQSFELATAPDAVPPAAASSDNARNAKSSETSSSSDKNVKAKESSAENKSTSAAILGTSLLLSVPMSAIRQQEQAERLSPKHRLKVEPIE